jgi:hypothetical protein
MIIGIIAGVLVLCVGVTVVSALVFGRALKNNAGGNPTSSQSTGTTTSPGNTTEPTTSGPTQGPDFTGDLRELLLPRPAGTDPWEDFPSKDGNLDLQTTAELFQDPDQMKSDLNDQHYRRGAVMHWTASDRTDVLIILFQFEDASDAQGFLDATEKDGIEDHDPEGPFGNISGSLTFVADKNDSNGKRSVILLSSSGNIVSQVVLWTPNRANVSGATALAIVQHGKLP